MSALLKLDFLSGKKTYTAAILAIVVTWLGVLSGVDMVCAIQSSATDPACADPPSLDTAIQTTWQAIMFAFVRKGVGGVPQRLIQAARND